MSIGNVERRLRRMKKDSSDISPNPPAASSMVNGEERLVLSGDNNLRIYRKEAGILWFVEFTRSSEAGFQRLEGGTF